MLRSYTELSQDYARQKAGENCRRLAWGAVSCCNASMNRQREAASPHRIMLNLVEGSLLHVCSLLRGLDGTMRPKWCAWGTP